MKIAMRRCVRPLRACREQPHRRPAAEQRDERAPFQLIELHSVPASQGQVSGYRISKDQSVGVGTTVQPVSCQVLPQQADMAQPADLSIRPKDRRVTGRRT